MKIVAIVEGHGDVQAVPVLLRRLVQAQRPGVQLEIPTPLRLPKDRAMRRVGELERFVELAVRKAGTNGAVLIVFDSDDDCPAEVAPVIAGRAKSARKGALLGVVLAKREFESWFLAAAGSLSGVRGLKRDLVAPAEPEAIRGAKEWLRRNMLPGRTYTETLDQAAFSALIDLDSAARARSFRKMVSEVVSLVDAVEAKEQGLDESREPQ